MNGIAGLPPMPPEDPLWAEDQPGALQDLASWGARVGAAMLDGLARLAILALCIGAGALLYLAGDEAGEIGLIAGLVIGAVAWYAYAPVLLARWDGQTPGHRAMNTRIVMADGSRMSGGRGFVREVIVKALLIETIGGFLFVVPVINYLFPLWDEHNETLHDKICATRVVWA